MAQEPEIAYRLELLLLEHSVLASDRFLETGVVDLPSTAATLAGQTIGAFEVVSQIGQGGMGSVWLARRNDGRFERQVALKFLNIALLGKEGEDRFKREGKILALLAHRHIAELIDAGVTTTGQPYLVSTASKSTVTAISASLIFPRASAFFFRCSMRSQRPTQT